MYGCQGNFRYPPRVQSASMLSGPDTLICFNLTSDRAGSNRMVSAFRYLLRPVTSFVGSTNLQNRGLHCCIHCHASCAVINEARPTLRMQRVDANGGIAFACSHQKTPLESSFQLQNTGPQLSPCLEYPAAETRLSSSKSVSRTGCIRNTLSHMVALTFT